MYDILSAETLETLITFLASLGYLGAFISGLINASSLFIAFFPSFIVVPILGSQLNPTLVGVFAGIGAGVGQYLHYYIGVGGSFLLSPEKRKKVQISSGKWRNRINRYGVIIIFIFAATPLTPDDLIWIPLGLMRYPKLKALAAAISGKIVLNLFYSHVGNFSVDIILDNLGLAFSIL